jgi:hypothetical protein
MLLRAMERLTMPIPDPSFDPKTLGEPMAKGDLSLSSHEDLSRSSPVDVLGLPGQPFRHR